MRQARLLCQADRRGRARLPGHRRGRPEGHREEARLPDRLPDPGQRTLPRDRPPGASGRHRPVVSGGANYPVFGSVHDDRAATTPEERLRFWGQTAPSAATSSPSRTSTPWMWPPGSPAPTRSRPSAPAAGRPASTATSGTTSRRLHLPGRLPGQLHLEEGHPRASPDEIRCLVYGTEGTADTHYIGAVRIRGEHPLGGRMSNLYTNGAAEHRRLLQRHHAASTTTPTVAPTVRSNLTTSSAAPPPTAAGGHLGRDARRGEALTPDLAGLKS